MIVYLWVVAAIFWMLGITNLFAYFALRKELSKDKTVFLILKASTWFVMSLIGFYFVTRL